MDTYPRKLYDKSVEQPIEEGSSAQSESVDVYAEMDRDELIRMAIELKTKLTETEEQLRIVTEKCFIDNLTSCYNRNYYEKFKDDNFNPTRNHNRIGLVFLDINDLKATNDSSGHEAGDRLIIDTANYLLTSFRKDDTVIRLGGDEFIVVCANSDNDESFADNLLRAVQDDIIPGSPTSVAYGVAVFDKEQDTGLGDTKRRAGRLMYECKKEMKAKT